MSSVLQYLRHMWRPSPVPKTEFEQELCRNQQAQLVSVGESIGAILIASTLIVGMSLHATSYPIFLLVWMAASCFYGGYTIWAFRSMSKREAPVKVTGRLLRTSEVGSAFSGALFGAAFLIFGTENLTNALFISVCIGGMGAGLSSLVSTQPRLPFRYLSFAMLPMIVGLTVMRFTHDATENVFQDYYLVIGALSLVLFVSLMRGVESNYNRLKDLVRTGFEARKAKLDLMGVIEATRDAFAVYNTDGTLRLCNDNHQRWFGNTDIRDRGQREVRLGSGMVVIRREYTLADGSRVLVHTDISYIVEHREELVEARRQAEEASRAKTYFLSTLSREWFSPLSVIIGFAEVMGTKSTIQYDAEEIQRNCDLIASAGTELKGVMHEVLHYAKAVDRDQAGQEIERASIEEYKSEYLSSIINKVLECHGLSDVETGLSPYVAVRLESGIDDMCVNEEAGIEILSRIIDNAVKFSSSKSMRIHVVVGQTSQNQAFVSITDAGIGMSSEDTQKVFEPFYQVISGYKKDKLGIGLGLTVAKERALSGGGNIVIESKPGRGTTVVWVIGKGHMMTPKQSLYDEVSIGQKESVRSSVYA